MTVKVISFRQLQRLTVKELQSYGEVIISVDGEDKWKLSLIDSQATKSDYVDSQPVSPIKPGDLPLSKHRQATGQTAHLAQY